MDFIFTKSLDNLSFQLESILWQNIAWFWDFLVCFFFTSQGRVWFLLFRVASGEQNSLGKLHFDVLAQFGVFIQHFSFAQKWFHIWYLLWAFTPVLFPSLGEWSRKSYPQGQDSPILSISMLVRQHTHTLPSSFVFKLHLT